MLTPAPAALSNLQQIASDLAGGPGAIYVGDLKQLVGPATIPDLGDRDGLVPLDSLQRHQYIFGSDYYQELLEKAKFVNPTKLVSSGKDIIIEYLCLFPELTSCR